MLPVEICCIGYLIGKKNHLKYPRLGKRRPRVCLTYLTPCHCLSKPISHKSTKIETHLIPLLSCPQPEEKPIRLPLSKPPMACTMPLYLSLSTCRVMSSGRRCYGQLIAWDQRVPQCWTSSDGMGHNRSSLLLRHCCRTCAWPRKSRCVSWSGSACPTTQQQSRPLRHHFAFRSSGRVSSRNFP